MACHGFGHLPPVFYGRNNPRPPPVRFPSVLFHTGTEGFALERGVIALELEECFWGRLLFTIEDGAFSLELLLFALERRAFALERLLSALDAEGFNAGTGRLFSGVRKPEAGL